MASSDDASSRTRLLRAAPAESEEETPMRATLRNTLLIPLLALVVTACGQPADGAPASAAGPSADAAGDGPAGDGVLVRGKKAGEHRLATGNGRFVLSGEHYLDLYLASEPVSMSDAMSAMSAANRKIIVQLALQTRDRSRLQKGQTFVLDGKSNQDLAVTIFSPGGKMDTFTVVDQKSLGTVVLEELSGRRVAGTVDIEANGQVVRGRFVATPLQ